MSADAAPGTTWAYHVAGTDLESAATALLLAGIEADGLSEDRGTTTAWFDDRPPDGAVEAALPGGSWVEVRTADWAEEWKKGIVPVTVGRVTIAPPWLASDGPQVPADPSDPSAADAPITLVIEPGLAFGTGHHETTTACLRLLQELPLAGRHVVDVGTGTGVLALAARALGAASVSAVDVDPEAVAVARANVADHPMDGIEVAEGSCAEAGPGDVVVANIITDKLLAIAPDLAGLVRPGGVLLASGIAVGRMEEAAGAFARAGITSQARPGIEWGVLVGRRT